MSHLIGKYTPPAFSLVAQGQNDGMIVQDENLLLLRHLFLSFCRRYLQSNHIVSVTRPSASNEFSHEARVQILRTWFDSKKLLRRAGLLYEEEYEHPASALFSRAKESLRLGGGISHEEKGRVCLFGVFGGQGLTVGSALDELHQCVSVYGSLVADFIIHCSAPLRDHASSHEAAASGFYGKWGLDILQWIRSGPSSSSRPDDVYLNSAPVSLPLIALLQMVHYVALLAMAKMTPEQGRQMFAMAGLAGHSQGVVVAAAMSASCDWDDLRANACAALSFLSWLGLRVQQAFPSHRMNPRVLQNSIEQGEGSPTPMLSIHGLSISMVHTLVKESNDHLPQERTLHVSLVNGPRSVVVTGHPLSLYGLQVRLRKLKVQQQPGNNATSQQKRTNTLKFSTRYLQVSCAFHNPHYLQHVPLQVLEDLKRTKTYFPSVSQLAIPVFCTNTGVDLRTQKDASLALTLAELICTKEVDWPKATASAIYGGLATHVIDFGPGGKGGIGKLIAENIEGRGIQVLVASALFPEAEGKTGRPSKTILDQTWIHEADPESLRYGEDWAKQFAPEVVVTPAGTRLNTRLTRLLGKPHVMVAGMTPTSANAAFCSAVLNGGYHVELAGGGQYSEEMMRQRVEEITRSITPGDSFAVNLLYLNQRMWNFQFPLLLRLRSQGYPISGICIGAGVPSLERATEIIAQMRECGMRHLSLKPSSVSTIMEVKAIADANPDFCVVLQWTGGRGGGHHSSEDLHEPMLRTYGALRSSPNLVLVIGSGFGDAEGSLPYVTGTWSLAHDYPRAPFDGILLGSRMLVAEEALGSLASKQAIIDAPGCEPDQWEKSYEGVVGGVITVKSEMNEPIHKIATRGVLLWKELDDQIFSIKDKVQRVAALQKRRKEIVSRLNADYQKVWFPRPQSDLQDMTYEEVAIRSVDLMYVAAEKRWVDVSWRTFVEDWIERVEERFALNSVVVDKSSFRVEDPHAWLKRFFERYPSATKQLLSSEDVLFFLSLCKTSGRKPVPFIPVLDENFEFFFKKDSLWQSEDLAAVGGDAGRVCILQGPVAAKFSKKVEPAKDILQSIADGHVDLLLKENSSNKRLSSRHLGDWNLPQKQPLQPQQQQQQSHSFVRSLDATLGVVSLSLSEDERALPSSSEWIAAIAAPSAWSRALLMCPDIVRGRFHIPNALQRMLAPRPGVTVQQHRKGGSSGDVERIELFDSAVMGRQAPGRQVPAISMVSKEGGMIAVTLNHRIMGDVIVPLTLHYRYDPINAYAPISEVEGREQVILDFYKALWLRSSGEAFSVSRDEIIRFSRAIDQVVEPGVSLCAPLDFAIRVAWTDLMQALTGALGGTDPLRLVHLDNHFFLKKGAEMLHEGDVVVTRAKVVQITVEPGGKKIQVRATLDRQGEGECMTIVSTFFVIGQMDQTAVDATFWHKDGLLMRVQLKAQKDIELLRSKTWCQWDPECPQDLIVPGMILTFCIDTQTYGLKADGSANRRCVKGVITTVTPAKEVQRVGTVFYECTDPSVGPKDPVSAYLDRHGTPIVRDRFFESGGYAIKVPSTMTAPNQSIAYAEASSDWNPIHTNVYFAQLAGHQSTIVHGMWSSAAARKLVEVYAADNCPSRVVGWKADFLEPVLPGQTLTANLQHVGMSDGRLLVSVSVVNASGQRVLKGIAEVEQPPTAYVFTGQGSQRPGMGMDLYQSSAVARAIWDRADSHFVSHYGWSILHIVRENPTELTVHFGGTRGAEIRQRYISMMYQLDGKRLPLFPMITEDSDSHTFRNPQGLLFATQFTQPALTLMERAAFADMQERGLIQVGAPFSGHSLGEFSALASIGDVLPIETLGEIVFYRGLSMAFSVPRKSDGSSDYGMVAVNPMRVSRFFTQQALVYLVEAIAAHEKSLLEIVNYNVEQWQYVAAGSLRCLDVLQKTLDRIFNEKIDLRNLMGGGSSAKMPRGASLPYDMGGMEDRIKAVVAHFVAECAQMAQSGRVVLTQGQATIPIPGIDVPFHSTMLRSGVDAFREYLLPKIRPSFVNVSLLVGRYIPNVTAEPFSLSRAYIERVARKTGSAVLNQVLQTWTDQSYVSAESKQVLGNKLLIELLAFQFASPVLWIETQDVLFQKMKIEKLVEIGPAPTLANMASRTLKLKYEAYDEAVTFRRSVLSLSQNRDELYFNVATVAAASDEVEEEKPRQQQQPQQRQEYQAARNSAVVISFEPIDSILTILSLKLKKPASEIDASKSIRDLCGGRSSLQNEIFSDLMKEFPKLSSLESPEEKPLTELARLVSSVDALGPVLTQSLSRMMVEKMPPLFDARKYLQETFGVVTPGVNKLLLFALQSPPSTRLGSESDAQQWWKSVAEKNGCIAIQSAGGTMPAHQRVSLTVTSIPDLKMSAELFLKVFLAKKLSQPMNKISMQSSLRDLTGGKSALQNELVGDLIKEFGERNLPENASEGSLEALAKSIGASYSGFGEWSTVEVNRLYRSKIGGLTVSSARDYLESRGLGKGRQNAVLLMSLLHEPSLRIGSVEASKSWLDGVLEAYAKEERITLPSSSGAHQQGGGGGGGGGLNSKDAVALVLRQDAVLRDQLESFARHLKLDLRAGQKLLERERRDRTVMEAQLSLWRREHDASYEDAIVPQFDSKKARQFESWWNWVRIDALLLCYEIINGQLTAIDREVVANSVPVINRSDKSLVAHMEWEMNRCRKVVERKNYQLVWELGQPLLQGCRNAVSEPAIFWDMHHPKAPRTVVLDNGDVKYQEVDREGVRNLKDFVREMRSSQSASPYVFIKRQEPERLSWVFSTDHTEAYLNAMEGLCCGSVSFAKKDALVIGAGAGSIGIELVTSLLCGGARVCVTTSRFSSAAMKKFCEIYQKRGSRGSKLVVVPFNASSKSDVEALIRYVYVDLKWDLDYVVPFAAIDESGRDVTNIDGKSEVAHRMMLTNLVRLIGEIVSNKKSIGSTTRPAHVLLPLSPNHGMFGNDGLYSESKVGLEMLMNKWHSETWKEYISLAGAVIGWTRGTSIMAAQDIIAEGLEKMGVRTFSNKEMAVCLLALFHKNMVRSAQVSPIFADLAGGLLTVPNLSRQMQQLRRTLEESAETKRLIYRDRAEDEALIQKKVQPKVVHPRANLEFEYHALPTWDELESIRQNLAGAVDLERVVVVSGFGEVGPFGSVRTRWEMEVDGIFSLEGCVELAWMMGLIEQSGVGWVDKATGKVVRDVEIKEVYEDRILKHTGIRLIEPELLEGYDPQKKMMLQPVMVEHDLPPFHVSPSEAEELVRQHGDLVDVYVDDVSKQTVAKLLKGAMFYVPKALQFNRLVAGLLPSGWDARRYGVPDEIYNQVDPTALYTLVSTVDALVSMGITDPYEFYEYMHVSEVGNATGSGQGGMRAQSRIFKQRLLDRPVQSDILQENFINTAAAWVNMLLMSSAGPIKTPVGACATAVESVEIGVDTILSGKAKVMIVGGFDDFSEEGSYEFAQMQATSNAVEELARGREPKEMSRPATQSRAGFMESQGAGNQVLMTAALAVRLGVPIRAIVAHTSTATDRQGRSVPAPGQGILTTAREARMESDHDQSSLAYRQEQLSREALLLEQWVRDELNQQSKSIAAIQMEALQRQKRSLMAWGTPAFAADNPSVSPLRAALSVFGLSVDDIQVASFHGTSTKANDINEARVLYEQLKHLGRTAGNAVPAITQKYLTGHPKGAAAAWMLNGLVQSLLSGVIPGNRNADNIDPEFQEVMPLVYFPSRSLKTDGLKAGLLKSFGFGQVGGEILLIHPNYVLANLSKEQFDVYKEKRHKRQQKTYRHHHDAMCKVAPFVRVKHAAPFADGDQNKVFLDPLARAKQNDQGQWEIRPDAVLAKTAESMMGQTMVNEHGNGGVGVDLEQISSIPLDSTTFLERNFTQAELDLCSRKPDPQASLAARWCAKEAISKAVMSTLSKSAIKSNPTAPLKDIEILNDSSSGAPQVLLHGKASQLCNDLNIASFRVTMTHAGQYAMAFAVAQMK